MRLSHSTRTGLSFGLTSAIITTLGLMVGLHSGTHSQLAVLGGILTIVIADAFSDSLGIHVSEEAEGRHTEGEIWKATIATFLAKLGFASVFILPVLLLELSAAIAFNIVLGLLLLAAFSYFLALRQNAVPWKVVGEHVAVAVLVIAIAHFVGEWIAAAFV